MIVINDTLHIFQILCIIRILNIRFRFNDVQKSFKSGIAFLKHFRKLDQYLNRCHKDVDIQRIGRKRNRIQRPVRNKIASRNQNCQIEHSLKEVISCMKQTHTIVIICF